MNQMTAQRTNDPSLNSRMSIYCQRCGFTAIAASIVAAAWMIVGGFVTYAPNVSANDLQNIYLSRMVRYGSTSILLQSVAMFLFFLRLRYDRGSRRLTGEE